MTMIQSETPYWQPAPRAPAPFTPNSVFSDPTYSHCTAADFRCPLSYALIAKRCSNVYLYGAGMYNFFNSEFCFTISSNVIESNVKNTF